MLKRYAELSIVRCIQGKYSLCSISWIVELNIRGCYEDKKFHEEACRTTIGIEQTRQIRASG